MADKVKNSTLASTIGVTTATTRRMSVKDDKFPTPILIGRDKYFDLEEIYVWLKGRSSNPDALLKDDKIISGKRLLQLTNRSKGWLWLNIISKQKLTRINLSADPAPKNPVNYFIEREVYTEFGDLIEVANMEGTE